MGPHEAERNPTIDRGAPGRGSHDPGDEIGLRIDQTLTQDATGTLVMLEFEAMGIARVRTEVSAQYVDHNLLQDGLQECRRPPVPAQRLPEIRDLVQPAGQRRQPSGCTWSASACRARPCWARTATRRPPARLGMLAMGAGGLEVAVAMAGRARLYPRCRR